MRINYSESSMRKFISLFGITVGILLIIYFFVNSLTIMVLFLGLILTIQGVFLLFSHKRVYIEINEDIIKVDRGLVRSHYECKISEIGYIKVLNRKLIISDVYDNKTKIYMYLVPYYSKDKLITFLELTIGKKIGN